MPSAAYTAKVTAFAPENCWERKMESGIIGFCLRASTMRNATRARTPNTPSPTESGFHPLPGPSMSA